MANRETPIEGDPTEPVTEPAPEPIPFTGEIRQILEAMIGRPGLTIRTFEEVCDLVVECSKQVETRTPDGKAEGVPDLDRELIDPFRERYRRSFESAREDLARAHESVAASTEGFAPGVQSGNLMQRVFRGIAGVQVARASDELSKRLNGSTPLDLEMVAVLALDPTTKSVLHPVFQHAVTLMTELSFEVEEGRSERGILWYGNPERYDQMIAAGEERVSVPGDVIEFALSRGDEVVGHREIKKALHRHTLDGSRTLALDTAIYLLSYLDTVAGDEAFTLPEPVVPGSVTASPESSESSPPATRQAPGPMPAAQSRSPAAPEHPAPTRDLHAELTTGPIVQARLEKLIWILDKLTTTGECLQSDLIRPPKTEDPARPYSDEALRGGKKDLLACGVIEEDWKRDGPISYRKLLLKPEALNLVQRWIDRPEGELTRETEPQDLRERLELLATKIEECPRFNN